MENLKLVRKVKKISRQHDLKSSLSANLDRYYYDDNIPNLSNEDYFDKLSDELLLQIFKRIHRNVLVKYAVVCKRWNRLMYDESLWRAFDLSNRIVNTEMLINLGNRGVKILGLANTDIRRSTKKYICNYGNLSNLSVSSQLDAILFNSIKIEYLDLTGSSIQIDALNALLKHCKNLKKISLESLALTNETFHFLSMNKSLDTLNLCMAEGVSVDALIMILSNLKSLECLNVGWCNLDREGVVLLCKHLPQTLTSLNLSGCKTSLLDNDIKNLCRSCPNLIELDLSDSKSLTGASIEFIATYLENIQYLGFSRCFSIMPSSYLLLKNCNNLKILDLFDLLKPKSIECLKSFLTSLICVNKCPPFSTIARPKIFDKNYLWDSRVN